jgi:soluble lytic murein transglycosylase
VDRWLRQRGDLQLDEFIETIPYDETRGYTKRVLSSYLTYAWLYQPNKPVPAISFSLKQPSSKKATPTKPARKSAGKSAGKKARKK